MEQNIASGILIAHSASISLQANEIIIQDNYDSNILGYWPHPSVRGVLGGRRATKFLALSDAEENRMIRVETESRDHCD